MRPASGASKAASSAKAPAAAPPSSWFARRHLILVPGSQLRGDSRELRSGRRESPLLRRTAVAWCHVQRAAHHRVRRRHVPVQTPPFLNTAPTLQAVVLARHPRRRPNLSRKVPASGDERRSLVPVVGPRRVPLETHVLGIHPRRRELKMHRIKRLEFPRLTGECTA